jgi:hypothetical protein
MFNPPKLTDIQAREIRDRYTGRYGAQMRLAREYGVTQTTIRSILRGKSYKRVIRVGERIDLTRAGYQFENQILNTLKEEIPGCVWRHAETPFCDNH